jgi:hypothetical protein
MTIKQESQTSDVSDDHIVTSDTKEAWLFFYRQCSSVALLFLFRSATAVHTTSVAAFHGGCGRYHVDVVGGIGPRRGAQNSQKRAGMLEPFSFVEIRDRLRRRVFDNIQEQPEHHEDPRGAVRELRKMDRSAA